MNYQEALDYLDRFINYEQRPTVDYSAANYKLERVEMLLARLGNPHRDYSTWLIAGSKGKGSTSAMIAAIAQAAGLRTGFYSKPHLHTFRERVRIDDQLISEEELAALLGDVIRPVVSQIETEGDISMVPTYFELSAALGFLYFSRQSVDVAVIEVGMGGRLDATNVVEPIVSVIAPISLEHTAVLGDTLAKIAFEKAGIIRPGGIALIAGQPEEADATFSRVSAERGATLVRAPEMAPFVADSVRLVERDGYPVGRDFALETPAGTLALSLPLLGAHQIENAQTAVCAFQLACGFGLANVLIPTVPEKLAALGIDGVNSAIVRGIAAVEWSGRLEIIARDPLVVVDGAHNGDSASRLAEALEQDFGLQGRQAIFVFGANSDKDVAAIVRELAPLALGVVLTPLHSARSSPTSALAEIWQAQSVDCWGTESAAEAIEIATGLAGERDARLVCATGSLYLVGEVRDLFGLSLGHDRP